MKRCKFIVVSAIFVVGMQLDSGERTTIVHPPSKSHDKGLLHQSEDG